MSWTDKMAALSLTARTIVLAIASTNKSCIGSSNHALFVSLKLPIVLETASLDFFTTYSIFCVQITFLVKFTSRHLFHCSEPRLLIMNTIINLTQVSFQKIFWGWTVYNCFGALNANVKLCFNSIRKYWSMSFDMVWSFLTRKFKMAASLWLQWYLGDLTVKELGLVSE